MNINARSVMNKMAELEALFLEHDPDVTIIAETWLDSSVKDDEFLPPGYIAFRKDRKSRGGGVTVVVKDCF